MRKKLVYSVGICDIPIKCNGIATQKAYILWKNMLYRCYSPKCHIKYPTYIGCTICDDWKTFSKFKSWVDDNYIDGYELDKDFIIFNNKHYSPETCIFIPKFINTLFTKLYIKNSKYPLGVSFHKNTSKFQAQISINGVNTYIGIYDNVNDAHIAYIEYKIQYLYSISMEYLNTNKISKYVYDIIVNRINTLNLV